MKLYLKETWAENEKGETVFAMNQCVPDYKTILAEIVRMWNQHNKTKGIKMRPEGQISLSTSYAIFGSWVITNFHSTNAISGG